MADRKRPTASQEDYLEAILSLVRETGSARVRDIAERLGVTMPSVTGALKTLAKRKLVNYSPYHLITLTDGGKSLGETIARRHSVLKRFLTGVLGMDSKAADAGACRLEHAMDDVTLQRLGCLVEYLLEGPGKNLLKGFSASRAENE